MVEDQEVLDDRRETVLGNLPDTLTIRSKRTPTTATSLQPDGMGGYIPVENPEDDSNSLPEEAKLFPCRVTAPRAASKGAEIVIEGQDIQETTAILVIGIPKGGEMPLIFPEDEVDVEDGETHAVRTWAVQRLLPHSSPFTIHVNCIDL